MMAQKNSSVKNPERRCGKAWKKNKDKPIKVRTPERQAKDAAIRLARFTRQVQAKIAATYKKDREAKELELKRLENGKHTERVRLASKKSSETLSGPFLDDQTRELVHTLMAILD
jgi:hypothetical protein